MKKFTRILCCVLVLIMMAATMSGCKEKKVSTTNPGELEPVTLKCYVVGDIDPNKDTVLENLNKKLQAKINATLDIVEIPWSDYKKKYSLILASGENIDLIYTSNWCFFYTEARKGAFMPLDEEMIKTYAPTTYEKTSKETWDYVKIDGKISMLPQPGKGLAAKSLIYREDLRKKYNVPEIKKFEDFDAYFQAIKENEPGMFPMNATVGNMENLFFSYMWEKEAIKPVFLSDSLVVSAADPEGKIKPLYEVESYKQWLDVAKRWNEKGYLSKDILSAKTSSETAFVNGTSASTVAQYTSTLFSQAKMYEMHPDWEMGVYEFRYDDKFPTSAYTNNGMAIAATSKNPERALMAYDLLAWDEDIYTAHCYGVEGVHFERTPEGFVKLPEGIDPASAYKYGGLGIKMGVNNYNYNKEDPSSALEEYATYVLDGEAGKKYGMDAPTAILPYDSSMFSNELTSLSNVHTSFNNLLITGMSKESVESQLKQFKANAETAGIGKILTELNKQRAEFLKK